VIPNLDLGAITPMILIAVGALFLPLLEVVLARMVRQRRTWLSRPMTRGIAGTGMSLITAALLLFALFSTLGDFGGAIRVFNPQNQTLLLDGVTHFLNAIILIAALLTVLSSSRYLAALQINHGEFYALVLSSVLGMMFLVASTDLIMLFLSLELMSIPVYALAGFNRGTLRSNESALKYFLIGSFASAILLYGSALLYGATGTVSLSLIAARFDPESPLALVGAGMLLIGLGFKISAVPFHQWAPDVYEGAPTPVTGFMATAVKVAAFGALMRVLGIALQPSSEVFYWVLWWMAVLSMTVGNVMAIIQSNTKRMLAYSSIAHAGYILVGITVGTREGYSAVLFYLLIYTFMSIAAFTVLAALARDGREPAQIDDLAGLNATHPAFAAVMALAMFALAGIPGTGGFMGKVQLIMAAVKHGTAVGDSSLIVLAVIAVINSAISLAYYLRLPVVMYMRPPEGVESERVSSSLQSLVMFSCAAAILLLGFVPQDVFIVDRGAVDLIAAAEAAVEALFN
jgi:NADH-quinone oxidoreductase subunit N